jgi:hypothetical protein
MFSPKSPLRKMFDLNIFHKKRIYALNEGSIEDYGKTVKFYNSILNYKNF